MIGFNLLVWPFIWLERKITSWYVRRYASPALAARFVDWRDEQEELLYDMQLQLEFGEKYPVALTV